VPKRTVKSCGPGASMVGVKSAEGKSARPGADEPAIRRRRRQQSPILRGERDISRKAIAQGMSDCLRCPVCSCACSCARLHTRPRVQRASGIPCSLPLEGQRHANLGQVLPRERERVSAVWNLNRNVATSFRGAQSANPESRDSGFDASHRPGMTKLDRMPHHPPLPRVAHQRDVAVDAVHELAIGQRDEQRKHHAEMQRQ
jgi:hypothetical protein